MKIRHYALLLCLVILMGDCTPPKSAIFFAEEYWWQVLAHKSDYQNRLEELARRYQYTLSVVVAPKGVNYQEYLKQTLAEKPGEIIFTGPLMSAEAIRLASVFPNKKFVILAMPNLDDLIPPNVIPVPLRRDSAFFEAGKLTGKALEQGNNLLIGNSVGVILSGLTREEREMLKEFERGFSLYMDTKKMMVEEIGTTTDRVKAVRAVETLYNRNVRLFLVKTYGLSGACIEKIVNSGGYFLVEDFPSFDLFPEKLFLSIEDDYFTAIENILRSGGNAPLPPVAIEGRVFEGEILKRIKKTGY